jgi:hypothetical protein
VFISPLLIRKKRRAPVSRYPAINRIMPIEVLKKPAYPRYKKSTSREAMIRNCRKAKRLALTSFSHIHEIKKLRPITA